MNIWIFYRHRTFSLTNVLWSQGYRRVFIINQTKLTIICVLYILINQVHGRLIKLCVLISFKSTVVWYNKANRSKIMQGIHLLLAICKNEKKFSILGLWYFEFLFIYKWILIRIWIFDIFILALLHNLCKLLATS